MIFTTDFIKTVQFYTHITENDPIMYENCRRNDSNPAPSSPLAGLRRLPPRPMTSDTVPSEVSNIRLSNVLFRTTGVQLVPDLSTSESIEFDETFRDSTVTGMLQESIRQTTLIILTFYLDD